MDPIDELIAACHYLHQSRSPFFGGGYAGVAPDALHKLKVAEGRAVAFRNAQVLVARLDHETVPAVGNGKPPRF